MQRGLRSIDVELNLPTVHCCKGGWEIQYFNQTPVSVGRNGVVYLKKKEKKIKDFGRPPSFSASRGKWEDRLIMRETEKWLSCVDMKKPSNICVHTDMSEVDRSGWEVGKRPRRGQAEERVQTVSDLKTELFVGPFQ